MNRINSILREALAEAKPSGEEIEKINSALEEFSKDIKKSLKKLKIEAEVFVGGSFAKKTLVKKTRYDVDVFIRFDKKYRGKNLSELTEKILKSMNLKDTEKVHGSRDYFKVNAESWFYFEVVPVLNVSNPKEAENITDLSYYHVKYVNKKANKRILDEIILAKLFCAANRVYGAESHIKGFSGYSLELLMIYYRTFERLLKALVKSKEGKIFVDIEKHYRNRNQIMMDMNSSRLESPIILVDPTYKQRNALATLSEESFEKFREAAKEFLKHPKIESFHPKKVDFFELERAASKNKEEFILFGISTSAQRGAIAGSKLLKFYNHLSSEISKHFDIKDKGFYYEDGQDADCYFIAKKRGKEILRGPPEGKKREAENFKRKHKKTFSKSGVLYAEEKNDIFLKDFVKNWKAKNKKIIGDMYITEIKFSQL